MITNRLSLILYCLLLDFVMPASASSQSSSDSVFYRQSLANLWDSYLMNMGAGSRLYTGAEYLGNGQRAKGSTFFLSDSSMPGRVVYQDQEYDNLELQYDQFSDDLLTKDFGRNYSIVLTREKVTRFWIGLHEFWYIAQGAGSPPAMDGGFYERLNSGSPMLFAHRVKKIVIPANAEEQAFYRSANTYYLCMGGRYYPVDNKSELLGVVKDKKDAVKKFIRDMHLNFNKDFEASLVKTIAYYAQARN
jgi:hypothetical protein